MTKKLKDILRGLKTDTPQTVGVMTVIPLIQDEEYHNYEVNSPLNIAVSNSGYGNLSLESDKDKTLIPAGSAYLTKQRAQDHGIGQAAIVGKKSVKFNNAACIQRTQGGTISKSTLPVSYMPLDVRQSALEKLNEGFYSKLWPSLADYAQRVNSAKTSSRNVPTSSNLIDIQDSLKEELEGFVGQFEPVDNQVGAIVLIKDVVVGVERTPNPRYWLDIWEPLIRFCYGAYSLQSKASATELKERRKIISDRKSKVSISELKTVLGKATKKENDSAKAVLKQFLTDASVKLTSQQTAYGLTSYSASATGLVGQLVEDSGEVVYFSCNVKSEWLTSAKKSAFESREEFEI